MKTSIIEKIKILLEMDETEKMKLTARRHIRDLQFTLETLDVEGRHEEEIETTISSIEALLNKI